MIPMEDQFKEQNKDLIASMKQLMEQPSMENERNVYIAMQDAIFMMPVILEEYTEREDIGPRVVDSQSGASMQVAQFSNEEGQALYPAFTDFDEVNQWDIDLATQNIRLLRMDVPMFEEMLKLNPDISGFVINPFNENIVITATQLQRFNEIKEEEAQRDALITPMSRLMDELRDHPTEEVEDQIYQAFRHVKFLMPAYVENPDDLVNVTEDKVAEIRPETELRVIPLENEDGDRVFPAFTDLYEVKRSGLHITEPDFYLVEMTMDGFEHLINASDDVSGFAINPFTHNVVIGESQFAYYHALENQDQVIESSEQEADEIEEDELVAETLVTTPEEEEAVLATMDEDDYQVLDNIDNEELEEALSDEMSAIPSILKAYLLRKVYTEERRFHYLVIVDKDRDGKSVFGDLREAAADVIDPDQMEFLSYNDPEAKHLTKDAEPFYEKSQKKGLFGFLKGKK